jgi:hypothetical protein
VRKAISWPARQIAINAGEDDSIVVGKILEKNTYAYGYDAQAGEYGNLISKDIIDPTKVVRATLQGADRSPACSSRQRPWSSSCRRSKVQRCREVPVEAWAEWAAWTSEAARPRSSRTRRLERAPALFETRHSFPPVKVATRRCGGEAVTSGRRTCPGSATGSTPMRTHRFGRKIKLPATSTIKHQLRKLMFEDSVKKAEAEARAEAMRGQLREETRSLA